MCPEGSPHVLSRHQVHDLAQVRIGCGCHSRRGRVVGSAPGAEGLPRPLSSLQSCSYWDPFDALQVPSEVADPCSSVAARHLGIQQGTGKFRLDCSESVVSPNRGTRKLAGCPSTLSSLFAFFLSSCVFLAVFYDEK